MLPIKNILYFETSYYKYKSPSSISLCFITNETQLGFIDNNALVISSVMSQAWEQEKWEKSVLILKIKCYLDSFAHN